MNSGIEYERLVNRGKEIVKQKNRRHPDYHWLKSIVDLSQGQARSREMVKCEACGIEDEAKLMTWVQDTDDIGPLNDSDWRLSKWRQGAPLSFRVFYYCEGCYARFIND